MCEECKKDRPLHSEGIPLCRDCYEDMFTLKYDVATVKRIDKSNNIILATKNDTTTHTLIFSENGELFLNDRLLGTDLEVVDGLRRFLKSSGSL